MDFTEARNSEWQWPHLGHMQVCTSLHTRQHPTTEVYAPTSNKDVDKCAGVPSTPIYQRTPAVAAAEL